MTEEKDREELIRIFEMHDKPILPWASDELRMKWFIEKLLRWKRGEELEVDKMIGLS